MKKITLALGLMLTWATTSQAQTGVQVGVKSGLTVAVLDGTINQGAEYKKGLHAGGILRWRPSKLIAIQPELTFSQQGSDNRIPVGPVVLKNKTKLSYLNVPVLLKIYLGNVVNLQFGPQFGLLVGARQEGQVGYYSGSNGSGFVSEDNDVKKDYKGDIELFAGRGSGQHSAALPGLSHQLPTRFPPADSRLMARQHRRHGRPPGLELATTIQPR